MLTRRSTMLGVSGLGLSMALNAPASAQSKTLSERLLEPQVLPDKVFGNPDAPVTVIEYASVTCGFCIRFHTETWPAFRAKYVETGKVRFIFREFPLDQLATAGFMLARCAGDDRWYPTLDLLYRTKENWAHAQNPAEALLQAVRMAGFTKESFEACLQDEKLFQNIRAGLTRANKEFGVDSTPTFFVNGAKHTGALSLEQFDTILQPLLK